ncbi:uncharacterized protein BCR38DRAFT_337122, partial [Pseudomassariella vexata]
WRSYKYVCTASNFVRKTRLCPNEITDLPIWHTLSCPANTSFDTLHSAIQVFFGQARTHCYDFVVNDPTHTIHCQNS